ncbi:hypothetical protein NOS3756_59820 (plasmid) [Nostoc sp. NIES-3756]|uniref:hypothetical protein n=1 Tax=Nostoc sp. NIES-3756 TaxID=1751286 RepID=UPI00071EFD12|nr:hypothetical protein [Nostoc sp. NIES-3756]BAT56970.1 hypothetical protein NOS3756_59820 [Nostoc sp. NIES-3756]
MSVEAEKMTEQLTEEESGYTQVIIVHNDTGSYMNLAEFRLSEVTSHSDENETQISFLGSGETIPPTESKTRDILIDHHIKKKFKSVKCYIGFEEVPTPAFEVGYTTPGQNHYMQQFRLRVLNYDGSYVQAIIEDQQ